MGENFGYSSTVRTEKESSFNERILLSVDLEMRKTSNAATGQNLSKEYRCLRYNVELFPPLPVEGHHGLDILRRQI